MLQLNEHIARLSSDALYEEAVPLLEEACVVLNGDAYRCITGLDDLRRDLDEKRALLFQKMMHALNDHLYLRDPSGPSRIFLFASFFKNDLIEDNVYMHAPSAMAQTRSRNYSLEETLPGHPSYPERYARAR